MKSLFLTATLFLVTVLAGAVTSVSAQTTDPHLLYEQNCGGCHNEHAGDFVQQSIVREGDALVGRESGRPLRPFLARGHGKLSPEEVEIMMEHLTSVFEAGALFMEKCVICHGRGVDFARSHFILKDGVLTGRYSDRDVRAFLQHHGRLEDGEVEIVAGVLARQIAE